MEFEYRSEMKTLYSVAAFALTCQTWFLEDFRKSKGLGATPFFHFFDEKMGEVGNGCDI